MEEIAVSLKSKLTEIDDHRFIADLVFYEGPLLSLYRTSRYQDFIYKWCDCDHIYNRWLIFSVNRTEFGEYINGNKHLLDLVHASNDLFLLDVSEEDDEIAYKRLFKTNINDLTSAYLPSSESYFDQTQSPYASTLKQKSTKHTINIKGEWYLDDFGYFQKNYSQLYSFFYALRNSSRPTILNSLKHSLTAFPWKGGFSTVNIFRELSTSIPEFHLPRVKGLSYSSPGTIELELLNDVANDIKAFIELDGSTPSIQLPQMVANIEKFLTKNGLRNVNAKLDSEQMEEVDPTLLLSVSTHLTKLANGLNLSSSVDLLVNLGTHKLVILKFFLSLYRKRIRILKLKNRGLISSL